MKYQDLIQAARIEGAVRLRDADVLGEAQRLVSSYVVPEQLARDVVDPVLCHLQLDPPNQGRAVIVSGGHGAGKSHLLSVVSAIAEHACLPGQLAHPELAAAARRFAGRFLSVRVELSATTVPLKDILCAAVRERLNGAPLDYEHETVGGGMGGSDALTTMVEAFLSQHPGHGILVVVDELYDYLNTRTEPELASDLDCLCALAHLCENSPVRFVAGLRQRLSDDCASLLVAQCRSLFEERCLSVLIERHHLKQILSESVLRKNARQQQKVSAHLQYHGKQYPGIIGRMAEFVSLFPIHPDYVDMVEPFTATNGGGVLTLLSTAVQQRLQDELPDDNPGLISYDDFWTTLRDGPGFRTLPDAKAVIACGQTLERVIGHDINPACRQTALRLARALLVRHIMTDNNPHPHGFTAQELRESLCPHSRPLIGEQANPDLSGKECEALLHELREALGGRFLCLDTMSQRFRLDPQRVEDYDRLVEKLAAAVQPSDLNRYYKELIRRLMSFPETGLLPGHPVWAHELEWCRGGELAFAKGYAFYGRPSERPADIAEQQYCIYFVPPHGPQRCERAERQDEVFVRLTGADEFFWTTLRVWGATLDLRSNSVGHARSVYESKFDQLMRKLANWFDEHWQTALEVEHDGEATSVFDRINHLWASSSPWERVSVHDAVNTAAGVCLSQYFREQALRS